MLCFTYYSVIIEFSNFKYNDIKNMNLSSKAMRRKLDSHLKIMVVVCWEQCFVPQSFQSITAIQ